MNDIELLAGDDIVAYLRFPHRVSKVTQVVVSEGEISCIVDMYPFTLKAPSMALFLPGQVVESFELSEAFNGVCIAVTRKFTDSLNLPVTFNEWLSLHANHFYPLTDEVLEAFMSCYKQVHDVLRQEKHPYREQIIWHLFSAYYYGLGYYVHHAQQQKPAMTNKQTLCERYIELVAKNFKQHRDIGFYANNLCVTKKYLSALLKGETGMTALEWIERYVVLYAKSCLTSTAMSIQEISDELSFSSQSLFGKYFKRVEGVSPKTYRQNCRTQIK